jgi:hypothetical protein
MSRKYKKHLNRINSHMLIPSLYTKKLHHVTDLGIEFRDKTIRIFYFSLFYFFYCNVWQL